MRPFDSTEAGGRRCGRPAPATAAYSEPLIVNMKLRGVPYQFPEAT